MNKRDKKYLLIGIVVLSLGILFPVHEKKDFGPSERLSKAVEDIKSLSGEAEVMEWSYTLRFIGNAGSGKYDYEKGGEKHIVYYREARTLWLAQIVIPLLLIAGVYVYRS